MYIELQQGFGWDTYKKVFAEYRRLPDAERPKTDQEKRDQWMVRFSRAVGRNLGPFFQAWGVPTSAGRAAVHRRPAGLDAARLPGQAGGTIRNGRRGNPVPAARFVG